MPSSLAHAALAALQPVLVASSALEGFERVCKAVPKHGHLAPMARRTRHKAKAPTGAAFVGVLNSLQGERKTASIHHLHYSLDSEYGLTY